MAATQDPRKQEVKQPFPPQQQEPPGLEKEMRPRPDYGEKSARRDRPGVPHQRLRHVLSLPGGDPPDAALKRAGQPAEMAPIYVLLASAESSYVTGMVYGATGGQLLP